MNCPKCNSDRINKTGTRRGKLAYLCRDCSYQFVQDALPVGRPKAETPPCPHCEGGTRKLGYDRKGQQRYQCKVCKRLSVNHKPSKIRLKKAQGLGGEELFIVYLKPEFPNDEGVRSFPNIVKLIENLKFWQVREVMLGGFSQDEKELFIQAGIVYETTAEAM